MEIKVIAFSKAQVICEFLVKIHRREKEELHLDDAFYAYGGGVPDYNYEMEILQSSLSDEEIRAKKLHIYFVNGEKYVCYTLQLKTVSEALSFLSDWGAIMAFHYEHFDPNWIESIFAYAGCKNPFLKAIEYIKNEKYSSELREVPKDENIEFRLSLLHKFLIKNFDLDEKEIKELELFGIDLEYLKSAPEVEYHDRLESVRNLLLGRLYR